MSKSYDGAISIAAKELEGLTQQTQKAGAAAKSALANFDKLAKSLDKLIDPVEKLAASDFSALVVLELPWLDTVTDGFAGLEEQLGQLTGGLAELGAVLTGLEDDVGGGLLKFLEKVAGSKESTTTLKAIPDNLKSLTSAMSELDKLLAVIKLKETKEDVTELNDSVQKLDQEGVSTLTTSVYKLNREAMGSLIASLGLLLAAYVDMNDLSDQAAIGLDLLAGAMTAVGVAMRLGFSPVGWAVGIIGGLVVAIAGIVKVLSEDLVPAVERFDDSISQATRNAVEPFMDMVDETAQSLRQLYFDGEAITNEMAEAIVGNYRKMREQAVDEISRQKEETLDNLRYIFQEEAALLDEQVAMEKAAYEEQLQALKDNNNLGEAEREREIQNLRESYEAKIMLLADETDETQQAYLARLLETENYYDNLEATVIASEEELRLAAKEQMLAGEEMTQENLATLQEMQEDYFAEVMEALVSDTAEREAIMAKRDAYVEQQAIEHAAEMLQIAAQERDDAIAIASAKYNEELWLAEELRARGTEESRLLAEQTIANALEAYDKEVAAATAKYDDVLAIVEGATPGLEDAVKTQTGKMKTKWDGFWENFKNQFKSSQLGAKVDSKVLAQNMADGLDEGLAESNEQMVAAWEGSQAEMDQAAQDYWQMASPSKVTEEQGRWIAEGLALGVTNSIELVAEAFTAMYNRILGLTEQFANNYVSAIHNMAVQTAMILSALPDAPMIVIPPFVPLEIPRLARGGIIDRATVAMIGERGREAVLPLEHNTGWMDTLSEKLAGQLNAQLSTGGGEIKINASGSLAPLIRLIKYELEREERRQGEKLSNRVIPI